MKAVLRTAAVLVIAWGVTQMARGTYIHAKANLAQALIRRSWTKASKKGGAPPPWPWADTTPVARLGVPSQRIELVVLEGGSGRTLAFGPGHVTGTAMPGEHGNVVIGGHRDTHFRFLKDLKAGDRILVEDRDRELIDYAVVRTDVVDRERGDLLRDFGDDRLTLVTCYPFDAIRPGGPERYVVTAVRCGAASNMTACPHAEM
jgi:sortase A